MRNFHVPLPDEVYGELRSEAKRCRRPATVLVRQAVEAWLRHQRRLARHQAITAFAERHAGSSLDLDPSLEAASLEHLIGADEERR